MMRAGLCVLGGLILLVGLAGCAASSLGRSPHERISQHKIQNNRLKRALNEDLDLLLQTDRGTRLTRWHDR